MKESSMLIVLVDDNEADNYFHQVIIEDAEIDAEVIVCQGAEQALSFLKTDAAQARPPDLLFLDINMPAIDGWQFLQRYEKELPSAGAKTVVVMLSTSSNPKDKERAESFKSVRAYCTKPLTEPLLQQLVAEHLDG